MVDRLRSLRAIDEDLKACREAARFNSSEEIQQRTDVEFSALTTHLMWAESVDDNQGELSPTKLRNPFGRWRFNVLR